MRLYFLVVAGGIVASGCTTTSYVRQPGFVPLAYGSVDDFSALVPGSSGMPRCEQPTAAPMPPGGRAVAWYFPGPTEQRITVILDPSGAATYYLDVRGDLSTSDESTDRTTIGLFLSEDSAVLSNRPENGAPVFVEVPLAEAISSERLGNPSAMLQRVLDACGRDI